MSTRASLETELLPWQCRKCGIKIPIPSYCKECGNTRVSTSAQEEAEQCICHKEGNYLCTCGSYHHADCPVHANYHAQREAEVSTSADIRTQAERTAEKIETRIGHDWRRQQIAAIIESEFASPSTSISQPAEPKCVKCGHEGGNVIDTPTSSREVCNISTCDCECEFSPSPERVVDPEILE